MELHFVSNEDTTRVGDPFSEVEQTLTDVRRRLLDVAERLAMVRQRLALVALKEQRENGEGSHSG